MSNKTFKIWIGIFFAAVLCMPIGLIVVLTLKDKVESRKGTVIVSSENGIVLYKVWDAGRWIYFTQNGVDSRSFSAKERRRRGIE